MVNWKASALSSQVIRMISFILFFTNSPLGEGTMQDRGECNQAGNFCALKYSLGVVPFSFLKALMKVERLINPAFFESASRVNWGLSEHQLDKIFNPEAVHPVGKIHIKVTIDQGR